MSGPPGASPAPIPPPEASDAVEGEPPSRTSGQAVPTWRRRARPFEALPQALRYLRLSRRLTQHELGELVGISQRYGQIERGTRKAKLHELEAILAALGCDLLDLVEALAVARVRGAELVGRRVRGGGGIRKASEKGALS